MKNGKSNNSETLTICWLFILFIESIFGKTFETKLTSEVSVNSKDCFYEKIYVGDSFQVNYQVSFQLNHFLLNYNSSIHLYQLIGSKGRRL